MGLGAFVALGGSEGFTGLFWAGSCTCTRARVHGWVRSGAFGGSVAGCLVWGGLWVLGSGSGCLGGSGGLSLGGLWFGQTGS